MQKNEDLVWDLNKLRNRNRAKQFAMQFEKTLCVFSGPVGQLYTNYNIYLPQDMDNRLVILPNPGADHDTFNRLPEDAAIKTGINIIPGEVVGKKGLYIQIPFKRGAEIKNVPLAVGLKVLMQKAKPHDPFLPVLAKGDLREMDQHHPCLHLHRLRLPKLVSQSEMERRSIRQVISEKLQVYLKDDEIPVL